jgi:hypothetical protein
MQDSWSTYIPLSARRDEFRSVHRADSLSREPEVRPVHQIGGCVDVRYNARRVRVPQLRDKIVAVGITAYSSGRVLTQ